MGLKEKSWDPNIRQAESIAVLQGTNDQVGNEGNKGKGREEIRKQEIKSTPPLCNREFFIHRIETHEFDASRSV